ncbi:unnamed protein product [Diabrotica balteata]|uniref:Uncharacterized protein n=1 Tax=Diabrotica balteata TaxID=107213 RepID=A0A9N9SK17_DIABA|nr:unnamed protein product [Diabrotica balteata]
MAILVIDFRDPEHSEVTQLIPVTIETSLEAINLIIIGEGEALVYEELQCNNITNTDSLNGEIHNKNYFDDDIIVEDNDEASNTAITEKENSFVTMIEVSTEEANTTPPNENHEEHSEMTDNETGVLQKNRKKKPNIIQWQKNEAKRRRCEGEQYLGYTRVNKVVKQNKPRDARQLGAPCTSKECIRRKTR